MTMSSSRASSTTGALRPAGRRYAAGTPSSASMLRPAGRGRPARRGSAPLSVARSSVPKSQPRGRQAALRRESAWFARRSARLSLYNAALIVAFGQPPARAKRRHWQHAAHQPEAARASIGKQHVYRASERCRGSSSVSPTLGHYRFSFALLANWEHRCSWAAKWVVTVSVIAATTGATTAPAVVASAGTRIDDGQGLGAAAGGAAVAVQGQGAMIDGDEEITARRRAWLINLFSRSPASLSFP